jgi:hypothetical protein
VLKTFFFSVGVAGQGTGWQGEVNTFADLPSPVGDYLGQVWLVLTSTGSQLTFNLRRSGFYIAEPGGWRKLSNAVKLFDDSEFTISDNLDPTKQLGFEISPISTGVRRVATWQDGNGIVAYLADIPSDTDGLPEGVVNLYYTETRVANNAAVLANTAKVSFPEAPNDGERYVRRSLGWDALAFPNRPYGVITITAAALTPVSNGVYVVIEGTTALQEDQDFSQSADMTLQYDGADSALMEVLFTAAIEKSSGGGQDNYDFAFFLNGSIVPEYEVINIEFNNDDPRTVMVLGYVTMANGDELDVRISGNGTGDDVTAESATFSIKKLQTYEIDNS